MWRSFVTGLGAFAAVSIATPARAQDHAVSFNLGYFALRGVDSRVSGDVLNANRCIDASSVCEPLLFEVDDFNFATLGAEWLIGFGDYFEAGAGIGYYQHTVHSIYENLTNVNGTEIEQDLKLRMVPITGTIRFVPTGRTAGLQPYFGVGVSFINWKYSEAGSFVDTSDGTIFNAVYTADGTKAGPVVLGGLRGMVSDAFLVGGEVRYQWADAELPIEGGFVGERIDLGGFTYQAVFQIRF